MKVNKKKLAQKQLLTVDDFYNLMISFGLPLIVVVNIFASQRDLLPTVRS